jgi:divalent metal cation (Fe/Co/Zn/Cd) transporter
MQTQPERDPTKERWMIGIMVSVTVVKFVLMVYCRRFKNEIVRAYAQDHLFDVITNSIGLAAAVLAIKFYWWLDPTGAILVSISIIIILIKMLIRVMGHVKNYQFKPCQGMNIRLHRSTLIRPT